MTGMKVFSDNLKNYVKAFQGQVQKEINTTAVKIRSTAVKSIIRGEKTGRIYPPIKNKRSKPHQASAPGQAPASDSGKLASSVQMIPNEIPAYVYTNDIVGAYMEHGTKDIKPRPWLFPAAEENRADHLKRMKAPPNVKPVPGPELRPEGSL